MNKKPRAELAAHGLNYSDTIPASIKPRRKELEKDIPAVYDVLKKGSEAAREVAAQTLSEVKSAMRINYFEDKELIQMQKEKYEG